MYGEEICSGEVEEYQGNINIGKVCVLHQLEILHFNLCLQLNNI